MKFSSEFLLGATPNQVWSTISDTDSLLSLVPGLHPVAHEGGHLVCRADVAVGSFSAELAGRIHVVDDESAHSVVVEVRTIQADDESNSLTAEVRLHQVDGHCRITVDTTTHLTGDLGAVDGVTVQHAWEGCCAECSNGWTCHSSGGRESTDEPAAQVRGDRRRGSVPDHRRFRDGPPVQPAAAL